MNILIIGDSFAAEWSVKYKDVLGWPLLLSKHHTVTNLAQAGVSEYKILKQLDSLTNLGEYDLVIVCHTSVSRVPTKQHPVHYNDLLHSNADLIYSDIEYHESRWRNILNRSLSAAKNFFVYHYDSEYQETVYALIRKEINRKLEGIPVITIATSIVDKKFVTESNVIYINEIQKNEPGLANHLSPAGNQQLANIINSAIQHEL